MVDWIVSPNSSLCHYNIAHPHLCHSLTEAERTSPPLDFGLGCETSSGQRKISRCNMKRNLKPDCLVAILCMCHPHERINEVATTLLCSTSPQNYLNTLH